MYIKKRGENWWTLYSWEGRTLADLYDNCIVEALECPVIDDPDPTSATPRLFLVQAS